jgi:HK97 family phage portal protein
VQELELDPGGQEVSEDRALSSIVWTPERGLSEPEVRGIAWDNFLLSDDYSGKWRTAADIRITPDTALQSTVVLASCRILAETIAALPLHVYRRTDHGGRERANDIPLYKVLSFAPNGWQTKFEFFEQVVMNLCLWGNSYTQIKSGRYGAVSELINLHPSRMDVERLENGRLRYSYNNPETGRLERYTQDQVMHIRWTPQPDGIKGMVPIEIAREAIALARACETHAARYWANSARPGVVLQTDGSLSPDAAERLRENWERLHKGSQNAYRTAVLTNGLKAEPIGFTAEQSQFTESRRFQSEEIARVYRLPLHLIQGTSGGDLETQGQEFVTYTLSPWLRRIESAISRSLIYNDDIFFAEFDVRGLLRADSTRRASYYSTMTNLGIMSINDCRALENLPPIEHGDNHFVAMNMQTLEDAAKPKQDPMAAMMAAGGAPPPAEGGPPSLSEVKTGKAPIKSPDGIESKPKPDLQEVEAVEEKRAFCPTGEGGGVDNSCGDDESGGSPDETSGSPKSSGGVEHAPDVLADDNEDGVTDAARVGVPAMVVPPPPGIGRIPNLAPYEREVEQSFIAHFESDPDAVSSRFLSLVTKQGEPPTFGTDDAKCLTDVWSDEDPNERAQNRATLNTCLHQTANAIAKRAFVQHLDTLKEGDEIMVTVGGCGAGKGFALKNVPQALEAKNRAKAVWDSAGDQNATENPWILAEAASRGLKVNFVYVHADPKVQWADPNRGVIKRASDPKDGRMVDAKVFADSYAIGAKNHHAFHQANKDNPNVTFTFLDNTGKPKEIPGVPQAALDIDSNELASFAEQEAEKSPAPAHVKQGALIGRRLWPSKKTRK